MADVNEIEWPSFESVLRELSPERVKAREMHKLDAEETAAAVEEAVVRDIPDSTVDDIAAVLMTEISDASVGTEAEAFVGEDHVSDDAIDQLLGNEEFMGYLVDLDNPAPEDLTVSPEEAGQANFIPAPTTEPLEEHVAEEHVVEEPTVDVPASEPGIEYAPDLGVEIIDVDSTPERAAEAEPEAEPERAPLISLFNNAETKLYTESDPEWVWAQFAQEPPPPPVADAPVADAPVVDAPVSEVDIDLVDATGEADLVEAPHIDLTEPEESASATAPASPEDPWAQLRPSDDEDVTDKKIVFWADRPKFFGGDARHEARARRLNDND